MHRSEIERAFATLDEALVARQAHAKVIVVGGAALALAFSARDATRDVDAICIDASAQPDFNAAVAEVGRRLGLSEDWLNDRAKAFAMDVTAGRLLWRGRALQVSAAATEQLLGMKLSALRDDVDYEDAALLLRHLAGTKEQVWSSIEPFLLPGMEAWKRTNFDVLWEEVHGSA